MIRAKQLLDKLELSHKHLRTLKRFFKEASLQYKKLSEFFNNQNTELRVNPDLFDCFNNLLSSHQSMYSSISNEIITKSEKFNICHKSLKDYGNRIKAWISKSKNEIEVESKKLKKEKDIISYEKELKLFENINSDITSKIQEVAICLVREVKAFSYCLITNNDDISNQIQDFKYEIDYKQQHFESNLRNDLGLGQLGSSQNLNSLKEKIKTIQSQTNSNKSLKQNESNFTFKNSTLDNKFNEEKEKSKKSEKSEKIKKNEQNHILEGTIKRKFSSGKHIIEYESHSLNNKNIHKEEIILPKQKSTKKFKKTNAEGIDINSLPNPRKFDLIEERIDDDSMNNYNYATVKNQVPIEYEMERFDTKTFSNNMNTSSLYQTANSKITNLKYMPNSCQTKN